MNDPALVKRRRTAVIPQSEIADKVYVLSAVRTSTSVRRTDVADALAVAPALVRRHLQHDHMEAELQ